MNDDKNFIPGFEENSIDQLLTILIIAFFGGNVQKEELDKLKMIFQSDLSEEEKFAEANKIRESVLGIDSCFCPYHRMTLSEIHDQLTEFQNENKENQTFDIYEQHYQEYKEAEVKFEKDIFGPLGGFLHDE